MSAYSSVFSAVILLAFTACQSGSLSDVSTAVVLSDAALQATIDPALGRLTALVGPNGLNPVWFTPTPAPGAAGWHNHGGDVFWPVRQERWPALFGADWPPAEILDPIPWQLTHAATGDTLTHDYPAPLHARANRRFTIAGGPPVRLVIDQQFERTAASTVPLTFWNILRVRWPDEVFVPAVDAAAVMGTIPPAAVWRHHPQVDRLDFARVDRTMVKLRFATPRPWIAARWDDQLLLLRQTGPATDGALTELWWSREVGCVELELVSAEHHLDQDQTVANCIEIEWHSLRAAQRGRVLVDYLVQRFSEVANR